MIADHVETMLQDACDRSDHGFGLPRYVERSFYRFLDCGRLERGFARVVCASCRYEVLVPFSCNVRALCPSCDGRRMAAGAARLVDQILPRDADFRQWTLAFPRWLRIRLLREPALLSEVLAAFVRAVFAYHRRRARERGVLASEAGSTTSTQFGGSFANSNVHVHTLVAEGVWHQAPDGAVRFHALPPPTDEDVEQLAVRIVRRITRLLARRDADTGDDEQPDALTRAYAQAVQLPMPSSVSLPPRSSKRRCAFVDGFSLHANTSVDAADRAGLERICRYILRPVISADRLMVRPNGRVEYRFPHPDPTGRTSWVTDGPSWCRRLYAHPTLSKSHDEVPWRAVLCSSMARSRRAGAVVCGYLHAICDDPGTPSRSRPRFSITSTSPRPLCRSRRHARRPSTKLATSTSPSDPRVGFRRRACRGWPSR